MKKLFLVGFAGFFFGVSAQSIHNIIPSSQFISSPINYGEIFFNPQKLNDTTNKVDTVVIDVSFEHMVDHGISEKIICYIKFEKGHKIFVESYYDNRQLFIYQKFKNDKREGEFIRFYKNGQKEHQQFFKDGKPISTAVSYYKSGRLRQVSESDSSYKAGYSKEFYENGRIKKEQYYTGEFSCIENEYYQNGNMAMEGIFGLGRQKLRTYYEDGTLYQEGYIYDALWNKIDEWKYYNKKGNLTKIEYYENNVLKKTRQGSRIKE